MKQLPYIKIETQTNVSHKRLNTEEDESIHEESDKESDIDTESFILDFSYPSFSNSLIQNIVSTLNAVITQTELKIKKKKLLPKNDCPFYNENIPGISIEDYLYRIKKYSKLEDSTLILSLIYIDRVSRDHNILLTKHNIYRICLTAIVIAIKYNEDSIFSNDFYSKVGGVSNKELNKLESKFMDLIDFKTHVSDKEFYLYFNYLKNFEE